MNDGASFGDVEDQRRSVEGESKSCILCILSRRCLLDIYVDMLSWQLNIQTWVHQKGQDWRHKVGDINIWVILKL